MTDSKKTKKKKKFKVDDSTSVNEEGRYMFTKDNTLEILKIIYNNIKIELNCKNS